MTKKTATIQVFKAGRHVSSKGKVFDFTEAQVQAIADAYDPAVFSAPAVIGHPKSEDPAYAWASAMRVEDGVLVADLDKVDAEFAEQVNAGRYPRISLSVYGPDDKGNPVPGQWYPRHIGFLGGAAPGVKGLAPVEFSEDDEYVEFASDDDLRPMVWGFRSVATILGRLRDWMIDKDGLEAADKIIPGWDADHVMEAAGKLDAALSGPRAFSEGDPETPVAKPTPPAQQEPETGADARFAELDAREQALAEREARIAERDQADAATAAEARRAEDAAFVEGLVEEGRLAPGIAPMIVAFSEALDGGEVIAFAEGEEAQDPRQGFQAFLRKHLGKTILLNQELAPGGDARFAEGRSSDDFVAGIDAQFTAAKAAGETISAAEALRRSKAALN